ncbi:MAG: hypothetical protein ACOY82_16290 [Pseudomonadota bacterium]
MKNAHILQTAYLLVGLAFGPSTWASEAYNVSAVVQDIRAAKAPGSLEDVVAVDFLVTVTDHTGADVSTFYGQSDTGRFGKKYKFEVSTSDKDMRLDFVAPANPSGTYFLRMMLPLADGIALTRCSERAIFFVTATETQLVASGRPPSKSDVKILARGRTVVETRGGANGSNPTAC